jgi:hypothetical protein
VRGAAPNFKVHVGFQSIKLCIFQHTKLEHQ